MNKLIKDILNDSKFAEGIAWKRRYFQANETIIREGDVNGSLFIIEEGELRISVHVKLENNRTIQTGIFDIGEGDVFGENCLYQTQICNILVTAITDGCLFEVNGDRLGIYLDDYPVSGYLFFKKLFEILTKRLNSANHRVEHLLAWGLKAHSIEKHL